MKTSNPTFYKAVSNPTQNHPPTTNASNRNNNMQQPGQCKQHYHCCFKFLHWPIKAIAVHRTAFYKQDSSNGDSSSNAHLQSLLPLLSRVAASRGSRWQVW